MSVVVANIDIAASPQQVWDYVMDLPRTREWVTIVRGIGHIDDGPLRPGFRMEQTLCLRGVKFKVQWTLEELRAPTYARWEGRGPARSSALIEDRLRAHDGGTRFDYLNEFKTPLGLLGAAASRALVGGIPEREANASLQRLKRILEGA
ncbi:MAG: SRPBCC family protein [Actinomycetota bacterium]|nr:SRPBCC family protein [Actinomycetota bacterium]